jgi:hypothetical protein
MATERSANRENQEPWRRVLILALIALVAGCVTATEASPSPTSELRAVPPATTAAVPVVSPPVEAPIPGPLADVLDLVGPIPGVISFTNWARIRESADATQLTGASPFLDKAMAIRNDMTTAGFQVSMLKSQATDWGFDVFDLDWDAQIIGEGAAYWVLRMRPEFDLQQFTSKLDAAGFAKEELAHGVLMTGMPSPALAATGLLFTTTGIVDDGRTLILSPRTEVARAILTHGPRPAADLSLRSVARLLGDPAAAHLVVRDVCGIAEYSLRTAPAGARPAVDALLSEAGALHPINALGVGYARAPALRGRIILGYPEAGVAERDLAGRRLLADRGFVLSLGADPPVRYAERSFKLESATVVERAIVLEMSEPPAQAGSNPPRDSLRPSEFLARQLMLLVIRHDLMLASCGI